MYIRVCGFLITLLPSCNVGSTMAGHGMTCVFSAGSSHRGARSIDPPPPALLLHRCRLLCDTSHCMSGYGTATYSNPNEFAAIRPAFVQSVRSAVGLGSQIVKARAPISAGHVAFATSATLLLIRHCVFMTQQTSLKQTPNIIRIIEITHS